MSAIVCPPKVGDSGPHFHAVKTGSEPVTHDVYRPEARPFEERSRVLAGFQPDRMHILQPKNLADDGRQQDAANSASVAIASHDGPADVGLALDASGRVAPACGEIIAFDDDEIRSWELIEKSFELDAFFRQEVPRCVAIERLQAVSPVCNLVWTHHSYRCVTVIASVISSVGQPVLAESVGVAVMVNPALRISAV